MRTDCLILSNQALRSFVDVQVGRFDTRIFLSYKTLVMLDPIDATDQTS